VPGLGALGTSHPHMSLAKPSAPAEMPVQCSRNSTRGPNRGPAFRNLVAFGIQIKENRKAHRGNYR